MSRRERGKSLWATHAVHGIKLGAFPRQGLLVAEGRLSPLLSRDAEDTRLASPEQLARGAERAQEAFASIDVDVGSEPVVRRLDLASEIRFDDPTDGLLFLRTFGGLQLPGLDQDRRASRQQTRIVSWSPARNVALRLYDAGDHHGTDRPGVRLRLERQLRYRKAHQISPESFTAALVARLYLGPLGTVIHSAPSMSVIPPRAAERRLIEMAQSGEISLTIAERLIGVVRLKELAADDALYDTATASGRDRQLRQNGVMLDLSADEAGRAIDVRAVLVALTDPWRETGGHAA